MKYDVAKQVYSEYFSLANLGTDIKNKFALISLICEITKSAKAKSPSITHYQIIRKLSDGLGIPDKTIEGLSIVCEDFAYGCNEFITFGLKPKDYISTVKEIFKKWIPF